MQQSIDDLPIEAQEEIRKAILAGRKLDAVKVFYTETNLSLLESKKIIEDEMERLRNRNRDDIRQAVGATDNDEMDQILDCIFANKKLDAVKIHSQSTGMSLMNSKKFIEDLIDQLNEDCPEQFQGGNGYQAGCVVLLLVLVVAVFFAVH